MVGALRCRSREPGRRRHPQPDHSIRWRFRGTGCSPRKRHVCVHPEKERERMKCSLADIGRLLARIENLGNLGPEELDQTWLALVGVDRPRRVCGALLIKALGYRLQENAIGGLKPSTRRLLERWGRNGSPRGPSAESRFNSWTTKKESHQKEYGENCASNVDSRIFSRT